MVILLQRLFLFAMFCLVMVGLPTGLAALFHYGVPALGRLLSR